MTHDIASEESLRYADHDRSWLERELASAASAARDLRRRLDKAQQQLAETTRAYNKTVENMLDIIRENNTLTLECDRLRWQCQREGVAVNFGAGPGVIQHLTPEEARAIRKAMARLHHPDVGGNVERMQHWNAMLDVIEDGRA
jgi:hypothetical protein